MSDRTWQQDLSRASMDSSSVANNSLAYEWYQVQALTGNVGGFTGSGLWGCYYSCDGAVAGTAGDGVNRWSPGGFDVSKLVRAASGARSWMVLVSPAAFGGNGPYYMIVELSGSSAQTPSKTCYSKSAPTGGSTTARPTATDETPYISTQNVENVIAPWRFHGILSNTGDFATFASKNTYGYMWKHRIVAAPVNPPDNLVFRLYEFHFYTSTGLTCNDVSYTANWNGRKFDNTANNSLLYVASPASSTGATYNVLDSTPVGGSYFNPGVARSVPAVLCSTAIGNTDEIGRLPDISLGPKSMQGKATPIGGPYTSVLLGAMFFPMTSIPSM